MRNNDEIYEKWLKETGGPAYPAPIASAYDGGIYNTLEQSGGTLGGMTLRDWLAGMALQGLLQARITFSEDTTKIFAYRAYKYADAMIAERKKK